MKFFFNAHHKSIHPALPDTSQWLHVATVSTHAVGACNGVVPADEVSQCLVESIGEAVPMRCAVCFSGNRLAPVHSYI